MNVLKCNVLVLNKLWQPVQTCSARRAVKLLSLGHAQVVEAEGEMKYQTHDFVSWVENKEESEGDRWIRSVNFIMRVPKVIVLALYDKLPSQEVKFSRQNVFLRDSYVCQYCGEVFHESDLNLDHVIPRDKGGKTRWDNIVTSCIRCNTKKANKLPHEAGMHPINPPKAPRWQPLYSHRRSGRLDSAWKSFI